MEKYKWHETAVRIRYKDTDRMGVVYYGNYLTFFEVARAEYMRDLGLPYAELESEGYVLAVTEAGVRYHANVGYDAVIRLKSRISELGHARVRFDYRAESEDGKLLVTGHTVHGCLNSDLKPTRLPARLRGLIEKEIF